MILPEKKLLILIIAFALVNPLNYAIMISAAPEGKVFLGYVDDAFQMALMKAVKWNFESPWDPGTSVFQNPVLGASYAFVMLGTVPALLNLDMLLVLLVAKFALSVAYLIIVYNVIRHFIRDDEKSRIAFIIFLFSSGIGWILYGAALILFGQPVASVIGFGFTNEFEELGGGAHALSHLTRVYWLLPEITGLLALLFFANRKYLLSGLLLGLTVLFYPTFAVGFALLLFVYFLAENYGKPDFFSGMLRSLGPVALISFLFATPWLLSYVQSPEYFSLYKQWYNGLPLVTLLITFALTLSLALYGFLKTNSSILKNKAFAAAFILFGFLSSVMNLYDLAGSSVLLAQWLSSVGLVALGSFLSANKLLIDVPFMLLFAALFIDVLKNVDAQEKHVVLWVISVTAITVVSAQMAFWWPARMRWFLLLPLSMAAVKGVEHLSARLRTTPWKIVLAIALISVPSLLGFNYYMHQVARSSDLVYVSETDYAAMKFLKTAEQGRILSSYQIGNNIPYFTEQRAVLFNSDDYEQLQRTRDYKMFFSSAASDEERLRILKEYGITYVFYGTNEQITELVLEGKPFLEKIYGNGTRIFRVIS